MYDDDDEPGILAEALPRAGALLVGILLLWGGWTLAGPFLGNVLGSFVDLTRYLTVRTWPFHRGYVEVWSVKHQPDGTFLAQAQFLYEVDDQVYRAWSVRLDDLRSRTEVGAREALKPFPVAQEISVSVNPLDPTDAVLDTKERKWGPLLLRVAGGCVLVGLVAGALIAIDTPTYAVALAVGVMIAFGALCRSYNTEPMARRESFSTAKLWQRHAAVENMRRSWFELKKGDLIAPVKAIGQPDNITKNPGGLQTWRYDLRNGLEKPGTLELIPSTQGLRVDSVVLPYDTTDVDLDL